MSAVADELQRRVDEILELGEPPRIIEAHKLDARQGNRKAVHELSLIHLEGRGVPADPRQAHSWFGIAAKKLLYRDRHKPGYAESQFQIGQMRETGTGVGRDLEQAAEWYTRAAERGHAQAQLALARIYADKTSPLRSDDAAYFWAAVVVDSFNFSDEEQASTLQMLEAAARKLSRGTVRALRRKVANWSPVLFADC